MKPNLTKLALTAGLGLGMLSFVSVAEAGRFNQGSRLTGQKTEQQPQPQLKGISVQGSRLTGQKTEQQPQPQLKAIGLNGSNLTGQTTDKQPTQSAKGPETSP